MATVPEPRPFEVERDGQLLAGEIAAPPPEADAGPTVVLLHAITATRDGVVHGSNMCPRRGDPLVVYDARGRRVHRKSLCAWAAPLIPYYLP